MVADQPMTSWRFETVRRPIARGFRTISIIMTMSGPAGFYYAKCRPAFLSRASGVGPKTPLLRARVSIVTD